MNIEVLLFGKLRELATQQRVVCLDEGSRLIDLIEALAKEYGDSFREEIEHQERLQFLINGRYVSGNIEATLKGGDTVVIMPVIIGG